MTGTTRRDTPSLGVTIGHVALDARNAVRGRSEIVREERHQIEHVEGPRRVRESVISKSLTGTTVLSVS